MSDRVTFLGIECTGTDGVYTGTRSSISVKVLATAPDSWSAHVTTRLGTR